MEAETTRSYVADRAIGVPISWQEYFPDEDISSNDPKVVRKANLICELLPFLESSKGEQIISQVDRNGTGYFMPTDMEALKPVKMFYDAMVTFPREALSCLGAAAYEVLFCRKKSIGDRGKITVRLFNHRESMLALKNLKAGTIGNFISVRGTVVRMSVVKPLVTHMDFTCLKCRNVTPRRFTDGIFSPPTCCSTGGCKSRTFNPERASAKAVDFQKIRIQEILSSSGHEEGRIPRTVECELTEDLVDSCVPADVVTVSGFVKTVNPDGDSGKAKGKGDGLFYLCIEVLSIVNSKVSNEDGGQRSDLSTSAPPNALSFSSLDIEFVAKFAEETGPKLFKTILHSVCPSIYGQELVKAGITLALFGGVQKHLADENKVPVRGDIHVLVVGDPGLGKSQLLKAAAGVAARGIYVCGNTTTTAGLTVAVVKDSLTGDYVFEAGAMVLADRGTCCVDEFDKLSADHQALLEAMEQQSVSVAKAGLVASLAARTSVLAAANPVGGRYNRAKTVNENLKMSAPLLSRFDLVFILLDKPDETMDQRLSEHILALHAGSSKRKHAAKQAFRILGSVQAAVGSDASLKSRVKLDPITDRDFAPLPAPLLRKYIAYAKQYVNPRMTSAAAKVLKEFYLQLRRNSHETDGTPITARQLESLVRLATARARVDLREEINQQDAKDVVEIMKESLFDKFTDEHGDIDFGRSGGMSKQKEAKRFLSSLQQRADIQQNAVFSVAELFSLADEIELKVPDVNVLIDNLNQAGYLLKKGSRTYQVQTSSYSGHVSSQGRR
ncbi:hypothetical protein R1sor_001921 [Riccia sorocarpa]|uniref:Probable DNA helicase MCM8 n=1 Tax=Riccia sorocarpa TaxID=122646 RepID=A0ABD3H393_9MARC